MSKDIENSKQTIKEINEKGDRTREIGKNYDSDRQEYERLYKEIEESDLPNKDKIEKLKELKEQYSKHLEAYENNVKEESERTIAEKQKEIEELQKTKEELLKVAEKLRAAGFLTETGDVSGSVDSTTERASYAEKEILQGQSELEEFERLSEEELNTMRGSILRR